MGKVQRPMIALVIGQLLLVGPIVRGYAGQTARAVTAKVTQESRPVLVCFGDSLTAGYGTDPGQSYPDYLQKELDQAHYRYKVVNKGISGNTTKDGVNRIGEVIRLHPSI